KTFTFDGYGRPYTTAIAAGGSTVGTYTTVYNSDGHLWKTQYPSGFTAEYAYTSLGYLSQLKDSSSGASYWTASAMDTEMHVTQPTLGNGVVVNQSFDANTGRTSAVEAHLTTTGDVANLSYGFDPVGNLTSRNDTHGVNETFC